MKHENQIVSAGFVRLPEVLKIIPVGRSSWWEGVKSGRFPESVKLGPRTTAWRAEDINNLVKDLSNQKNRPMDNDYTGSKKY